jgi:DnaJ-class molecular chaperone
MVMVEFEKACERCKGKGRTGDPLAPRSECEGCGGSGLTLTKDGVAFFDFLKRHEKRIRQALSIK